MTNDIQHWFKKLGESGCYYFSLGYLAVKASGRQFDIVSKFVYYLSRGWMTSEAFVNNPDFVFGDLVGGTWTVLKAGPGHSLALGYVPQPGEFEILRYERPNPDGGEPLAHFVVGDGSGHVAWDPWENSLTVAKGTLISKRILRRIA